MKKSITKFANKLHVTEHTLYKQLIQLEEELEVTLFKRKNRLMILTDAGINLRERAEQIIELTNKTVSELRQTNEDIHGEIAIGSGETEGFSMIADVIKNIQNEYPIITFQSYTCDGYATI